MAKMFYTLQEAAEKLGKSEDELKQMAVDGQLQQFRDRDKLMFKREQVDKLAPGGAAEDSGGPIPLAGSGDTDAGDTDALDLREAEESGGPGASAPSVFDTGEVDPVDPAAQTQVTQSAGEEEDLSLESVGSGSGLLDLTRESDDTSLGAELLEEIQPDDTAAGFGTGAGSGGATGIFESGVAVEADESGQANLEDLQQSAAPAAAETQAGPSSYVVEEYDPAGSGMSSGLLLGTMITMVVGLLVVIAGMMDGLRSSLAEMMTESVTSLGIWMGGLAALVVVLGVVGMTIARAAAR
ncbi:MAG: helix-turn-helix domain-containing protein [Phycisphaeraceae bacterium]